MIDTLLRDFAQTLHYNSPTVNGDLSLETFYAALCGKFENYIRWKFTLHIYKNNYNFLLNTLSIETCGRTDIVFIDKSNGKSDVHFIEWKSMTLPVKGQTLNKYQKNWTNNAEQLYNTRNNTSNKGYGKNWNSHYWSLFVFVDFNDSIINELLLKNQHHYPKDFKDGILATYDISIKNNFKYGNSIYPNLIPPPTKNTNIITLQSPSWCNKGEEIKLRFGFIQIQPPNSSTYQLTSI
jgi:hypothetical protein